MRRTGPMSLVLLVALALTGTCVTSTAFAARGHVFGGAFGEPCTAEPCGDG
jgi:hypothetical protein